MDLLKELREAGTELRHFFAWIRHYFVVCWRQQRGRWFYLRDRPDWFVYELAAEPDKHNDSDDLRAILREARAERDRRIDAHLRALQPLMRGVGLNDHAESIERMREQLKGRS
jgi:hypothetical protein